MKFTYASIIGLIALLLAPSAFAQGWRDFYAEMAAEWQTKYTESPGRGEANLHLDLATLTLSWDINFKDLSGPVTGAKLYGPAQPGANGKAFLDLVPKGAKSPVRGSAVINEAQVQYLLYGWTYITLTTDKFSHGEIRGQVDFRGSSEAKK